MKSQQHNEGELAELKVKIEKSVVEAFENMSNNSKIPVADLVVLL